MDVYRLARDLSRRAYRSTMKAPLVRHFRVGLMGDAGPGTIRDSDRVIAMLIGLLRSLGARVPR